MSWLKLDDGFAAHPKLAALNDREFRVWVRLLCYLSRYRSADGLLTDGAYSEVPGLNRKLSEGKFSDLSLLDPGPDGLYVHDWISYLPKKDGTLATRQQRYRERKSNAVTEGVTDAVTNGVTHGVSNALPTASSRDARTRPVPSRVDQNPVTEPVLQHPARAEDDGSGSGGEMTDEELDQLAAIANLVHAAEPEDIPW